MKESRIALAAKNKRGKVKRTAAVGKHKNKIRNGERIAAVSIAAICIVLGLVFYSLSKKFFDIAQRNALELSPDKEITTVVSPAIIEQNDEYHLSDDFDVSSIPIAAAPQTVPQPLPINKGQIVFMLDDAGNNLSQLQPFLEIPVPLTIAVLPSLSDSKEAARRIRAAGKTVFLHQPMEASGGAYPGPGAIYSGMNRSDVMAILKRNADELGPIAGINNHQGSKITMDKEIMDAVLDFCIDNNLIFLDSRTTQDTVVPILAENKGIKILQRSIFLDNTPTKDAMQKQIDEGVHLLGNRRSVVMIGHIQSTQLAPLLKSNYLSLLKDGYMFSTTKDIYSNEKN
ncbi:MAG: hypothetical protein Ta2B_22730 [Termitinemataceae bacterium]|nr:MAG: hypothetical protein Ta2B_22730 [Termitinemataceae bacterium]